VSWHTQQLQVIDGHGTLGGWRMFVSCKRQTESGKEPCSAVSYSQKCSGQKSRAQNVERFVSTGHIMVPQSTFSNLPRFWSPSYSDGTVPPRSGFSWTHNRWRLVSRDHSTGSSPENLLFPSFKLDKCSRLPSSDGKLLVDWTEGPTIPDAGTRNQWHWGFYPRVRCRTS
jgi:hypothetical protein